jgi:hypothetical protein
MAITKAHFMSVQPKLRKIVGAREFLNLVTYKRDTIISSKIIYPKLGSKGLGKFVVELKSK